MANCLTRICVEEDRFEKHKRERDGRRGWKVEITGLQTKTSKVKQNKRGSQETHWRINREISDIESKINEMESKIQEIEILQLRLDQHETQLK